MKRLGQIIHSSKLHGFHSSLRGVIRCEHDHLAIYLLGRELLEYVHTISIREFDIEQHDVRRP